MQVQAQVHLRGRFAPPVLGPVHAVGKKLHHRGIDRMDADPEPPQQSTPTLPGGKGGVQVLQSLKDSPEERLDELG